MAGGAWEYQASYITDKANAKSAQNMVDWFDNNVDSKHKTTFIAASENISENNYNLDSNKLKYGIGIWETSNTGSGQDSWNGEYSYFLDEGYPFEGRGCSCASSGSAGLFYFNGGGRGLEAAQTTFRPVLWKVQS